MKITQTFICCFVFLTFFRLRVVNAGVELGVSSAPLTKLIVNGFEATPHSWPWQVSIKYRGNNWKHWCGASVLSPRWVITAAHCVYDKDGLRHPASNFRVVFGEHNLLDNEGTERQMDVAEIIEHENYRHADHTFDNDIALFRLPDELQFNRYIKLVSLAKEDVEENVSCVTTGWGYTNNTGYEHLLNQVEVLVISRKLCNDPDWHNGMVTNNMLCAGYSEGGKDSCYGDSGGPLVCLSKGIWRLNGITSWGDGCAKRHKPGVYTRVLNYLEWIQAKTRGPSENFPGYTKECRLTRAGREYGGTMSVTESGHPCQAWSSNRPHSHAFIGSTDFPEGSASAAGNKCRNPDKNHHEGVWCYTTSSFKRWEHCNVPFCSEFMEPARDLNSYTKDCRMTRAGREYGGSVNVTESGLSCQPWVSTRPHNHGFSDSTDFPEGSAAAVGNKCRNPDKNHHEDVWCYTKSSSTRWEKCNVPLCSVFEEPTGRLTSYTKECRLTRAGREYGGSMNVTESGLPCQPWASTRPHNHRFSDSTDFPEGSAAAAGNKCRNPDKNHHEDVWCYTKSSSKRWENCNVPLCSVFFQEPRRYSTLKLFSQGLTSRATAQPSTSYTKECRLTRAGREYGGSMNVTESGLPCQAWSSNRPHVHAFIDSTDFPEGSASAAGNKCRNPDEKHHEYVWCYTTSPSKRWENCNVPMCSHLSVLNA